MSPSNVLGSMKERWACIYVSKKKFFSLDRLVQLPVAPCDCERKLDGNLLLGLQVQVLLPHLMEIGIPSQVSSFFSCTRSSSEFSMYVSLLWKTGKLQQTLACCIERSGIGLHSGKVSTVKIWPHFAGEGRWFDFRSNMIPASIDFVEKSPLCTTLLKDGLRIRTVEHLLSALEATGVDNCRIEIDNLDGEDKDVEVSLQWAFFFFFTLKIVMLPICSCLRTQLSFMELEFFWTALLLEITINVGAGVNLLFCHLQLGGNGLHTSEHY